MEYSSLHAAIESLDLEAVRKLIAAGADVNGRNAQGVTALGVAVSLVSKIVEGPDKWRDSKIVHRIVEDLIKAGANVRNVLLRELHAIHDDTISYLLVEAFAQEMWPDGEPVLLSRRRLADAIWLWDIATKLDDRDSSTAESIVDLLMNVPEAGQAELIFDRWAMWDNFSDYSRSIMRYLEQELNLNDHKRYWETNIGVVTEAAWRATLEELLALEESEMRTVGLTEEDYYHDGRASSRSIFNASLNPNPGVFAHVYYKAIDYYYDWLGPDDSTTVMQAIAKWLDDAEAVERFVGTGAILTATANLDPPLHISAEFNPSTETMGALIEAGADVNLRTADGATPLLLAAKHNPNPETLLLLIEAGADLAAVDSEGHTVVELAEQNPEIAEGEVMGLLRTLTTTDDLGRRVELIEDFRDGQERAHLEQVAKQKRAFGELLRLARAGENDVRKYEAAIADGASLETTGDTDRTPMMWVAQDCTNADVVRLLATAGADVNARDKNLNSPLILAAGFNANPEVVAALLEAGADLELREEIFGATALMYAVAFRTKNSVEAVRILLEAGADVEATNDLGRTPLLFAAQHHDNPEIVRTLVAAGANVKATDAGGLDAIAVAAECLVENSALVGALEAAGVRN